MPLELEAPELPRGKLWARLGEPLPLGERLGEPQPLDEQGERAELLQCTVSRSSSRPRSSTEKWRKPCSEPTRNVSRANASIRLFFDMPAAAGGGRGGVERGVVQEPNESWRRGRTTDSSGASARRRTAGSTTMFVVPF